MRNIDRWMKLETASLLHRLRHTDEVVEIDEDDIISTEELPLGEFFMGVDEAGEEIIETHKNTLDYAPCYDARRVSGHTYRPYKTGSALWRKKANQALAAAANENFLNR